MNDANGSTQLETGRIKWYSIARQFGFITRADGTDVFLHHAHIIYVNNGNCDHGRKVCARAVGLIPESSGTTLATPSSTVEQRMKNQPVKFAIAQSQRGPEARRVKRA